MFGVPAATQFDLKFRLFGIPVRVSPFFWVFSALIGGNPASGTILMMWVGCVFVSILVHEFGHALTNRVFGVEPSVYLIAMGGLCVSESGRVRPWQRFLVILMGPGAGFLLAGLTLLVGSVIVRESPMDVWRLREFWFFFPEGFDRTRWVIACLIRINIFWGLINLFPIMPLDGGQLASILLTWQNRSQGLRRAYILSILTAGGLGIYCFQTGMEWNAILLGFLTLSSFQALQTLHYQTKFGDSFEDEADWWKR